MLKNASSLAIGGFDTEENEPVQFSLILIHPRDLIFTEPPRPSWLQQRAVTASRDCQLGALAAQQLVQLAVQLTEKQRLSHHHRRALDTIFLSGDALFQTKYLCGSSLMMCQAAAQSCFIPHFVSQFMFQSIISFASWFVKQPRAWARSPGHEESPPLTSADGPVGQAAHSKKKTVRKARVILSASLPSFSCNRMQSNAI